MKNFIYFLFAIAFVSVLGACNNTTSNNQEKTSNKNKIAVISFEKKEHNFGTVTEGEKVTYAFRFVNNGNTDLQLTSVGTSCGCTASDYSVEPIKPGDSGKIQITFDSSHRLGMQHKKITIRANTNPEFTVLNIYAKVIEKESEN